MCIMFCFPLLGHGQAIGIALIGIMEKIDNGVTEPKMFNDVAVWFIVCCG